MPGSPYPGTARRIRSGGSAHRASAPRIPRAPNHPVSRAGSRAPPAAKLAPHARAVVHTVSAERLATPRLHLPDGSRPRHREREGKNRGKEKVATWSAPVCSGRNCPRPAPARCSAVVRVRRRPQGRKRTPCAQTLTARTAWYVEGNSKATPLTPPHQGKRSAQAGNAETAGGVKDRSRRAVTGTAWHGATPESLTAERRDAHASIKEIFTA